MVVVREDDDPNLIYEGEDGFDMRYCAQGMWELANYFAVNASYSHSYAYTRSEGSREMFLVKILTEDSFKCPPNQNRSKRRKRQAFPKGQCSAVCIKSGMNCLMSDVGRDMSGRTCELGT